MSLTVLQAIAVANFFYVGEKPDEDKLIKRLTSEQRDICNQAFKMVARASQADVDAPEQNPLQADIIRGIESSLNDPLAPAAPDDTAWYAKPFYFIAHKINSFAKGFANFFWRVGSGALYEKASDYRADLRHYREKITNYLHETGDGEDRKEAGYKDINRKIITTKETFDQRIKQAEEVEDSYGFCLKLQMEIDAEELKNKRFSKQKLSEETLTVLGQKNETTQNLYQIASIAIKGRMPVDRGSELELAIFHPIHCLLDEIQTEKSTIKSGPLDRLKEKHKNKLEQINAEAKPEGMSDEYFKKVQKKKIKEQKEINKKEKIALEEQLEDQLHAKEVKEYSTSLVKAFRKAGKEIMKRYDTLVKEDGTLAQAREALQANVDKKTKMEAKEKLLRAKYPELAKVK